MELTNQKEVISIETELEKLRDKWKEADRESKRVRFRLPYTYDQFVSLLSAHANIIFRERRENSLFEIDACNESFLKLLYQYSTYDKEFESHGYFLEKGIMVIGAYGCGKSAIMEAYSRMMTNFADQYYFPKMKFIKSIKLFEELKSGGKYERVPMIIDEFGREKKEGKYYGEEIQPIFELLSIRYDLGSLTHGTSNFKLETLQSDEYYGAMIGDRLKSMFNFILLEGKSRRK